MIGVMNMPGLDGFGMERAGVSMMCVGIRILRHRDGGCDHGLLSMFGFPDFSIDELARCVQFGFMGAPRKAASAAFRSSWVSGPCEQADITPPSE